MELFSLLYISASAIDPGSPEMQAIALTSTRRNGRCGVSGYLYYDSDHFLQVLEGLEPDIAAIYADIERDPRHRDVRLLDFSPARHRKFGGWTMGIHSGEIESGLLAGHFGADILEKARREDAPELLRFLRDLSIGRADAYSAPRRSPA